MQDASRVRGRQSKYSNLRNQLRERRISLSTASEFLYCVCSNDIHVQVWKPKYMAEHFTIRELWCRLSTCGFKSFKRRSIDVGACKICHFFPFFHTGNNYYSHYPLAFPISSRLQMPHVSRPYIIVEPPAIPEIPRKLFILTYRIQ